MSLILYHNDEQERIALESKALVESETTGDVNTEVAPLTNFYLAEDYHQKYYLQGVPELFREIRALFPDFSSFVNSTTAARLNGIIGGYGDKDLISEEIESYGLSEEGKELLMLIAR
jgi:peptide-methionine (S)-S-oxide reductase